MTELEDKEAEKLKAMFSGGKHVIGAPTYQRDGVVAYSLQQANQIFENLMEARVEGKEIPFIFTQSGCCSYRNLLMLDHMMYQQEVDRAALGVAVIELDDAVRANTELEDYYAKIKATLTGDDEKSFKSKLPGKGFCLHVAPAINVYENGVVTPFILDPDMGSKPSTAQIWAKGMMRTEKEKPLAAMLKLDDNSVTALLGTDEDWLAEEHSPEHLVERCRWAEIPAATVVPELPKEATIFEKQQNNVMRVNLALDEPRKKQSEVVNGALQQGISLPNCGPRALKVALAAQEKIQRHRPGNGNDEAPQQGGWNK